MTVMDNEDPADPSVHEPRVTGAPEAIWLVYGELEHDDTHANCADSGDVTWCEDAQFPADVRYLRADLLYQQAREIATQEVAAERERWTKAIGAQMPADFKDWHENGPAELPEIAAWVIQNLRADRDSWADQASQRAQDALDLVAAERERLREAGWVCADGFPALLGHKPLKPGAKLYAAPDDWA